MLKRMFSNKVNQGPFNYVSGARCIPVDKIGCFVNREPRSGKTLAEIPSSGPEEVDRVVKVAQNAFIEWKKLSGMERGRFLIAAAQKLRERVEEIAQLDVLDNGKPIWEARFDMESVIGCLEYYGGLAPAFNGQHIKHPGGSFSYVTREPYGVVGGIGAWNYPLQTCTWKAAPALACGNTFIYKPSQFTPLTALELGDVFKEVGIPDGVFNIIQGEGETGALLSQHPGCSKISFTGSVPTGEKIMKSGAVGIRPVTLELGGKSPLIIFDDADMKNAIKGAMMANFFTQGQVCSNGTRIFVQRGIYDKFVKNLVYQCNSMKIGDPFDEKTTVGATITKEQADKVLGFIQRAKNDGVKIECGGERINLDGELSGGYYISPCVVTNCTDDMEVAREEIFGPVACIFPFDTEKEAIQRANKTPFGLGGGVFTKDLSRAHRVVDELEAGTCWINTYNLAPPEVPFGGFKMSGIGRENGTAALEYYSQTKTIYVEMNDVDCGQLYVNE